MEREGGLARQLAHLSRRSPIAVALAALALVVLIAVPFLNLDLGSSDAGSNPTSMTTRRAYDLIAQGFGPGVSGPIILATAINQPSALNAVELLPQRLRAVPGVAAITPAQLNPARTAATIVVIPSTSPQSDATKALIQRLKDRLPAALGGADATVYVGGPTATFVDVGNKISSALPLFFAVVIALGFLILMAVFRSIAIPLIAAVMNMLSIGAALGVLVAVFQWGWLGTVFGVSRTGPIESFMPIFLFAVLFGLSMDYQVFLVSRIQEEHLHGRRNPDAVEHGLSLTTRLIGAAALIMGAVFVSFAFGDQRVIKEFGIGLGSAILIDAFVIRLFLVPALLQLFGEANWWFPRWLDRLVPNVSIEGPTEQADLLAEAAVA
jgi:RND superfamily putative drug exporter